MPLVYKMPRCYYQRPVVHRLVEKLVNAWLQTLPEDERGHPGGCCLAWAYFGCQVLNDHCRMKAQLQAGTAFWPRLDRGQTDPLDDDPYRQFGYQFELSRVTLERIAAGLFPEMHVWIADATPPGTIIDFTTSYWPRRCEELLKVKWLGAPPPPYFWVVGADDWPDERVAYRPDNFAIRLAYQHAEASGLKEFYDAQPR